MKKQLSIPSFFLIFFVFSACILTLSVGTSSAAGWQTSTADSTGTVGDYSSIAVDDGGTPHIAYRDYTNKVLKYATWIGSAWQTTVIGSVADGSLLSGGRNGIAIDGNGNPHIVYYKTNIGYYYIHWTGSAWTAPYLILPPPPAPYTYIPMFGDVSLAVDKITGIAHVSMLYYGNGYSLGYWNSGMAAAQVVDEDDIATWRTGFRNAISVDSTGKPHISYEGGDGADNQVIKHAQWTGAAWAIEIVDGCGAYPDMGSGGRPQTSIAVDTSNRPHIVYYGTSGKYKYARWTGSAWSITSASTVYAPLDDEYASLALDKSDNPHIAMQIAGYDLQYATLKSGTWIRTTIDSSSGNFCSIAVDGGNNVHISYYDDNFSKQDLKYASNARVSLMSPNGGETIVSGSNVDIDWAAPHTAVKFKLSYSIDNGLTWYPITPNFVTGSSYPWAVPGIKKTKATCRVKVTGYTSGGTAVGSDKSNAPFTIENVTFVSPTLGQSVTGGGELIAQWVTHALAGTPSSITVSYTLNGGLTWKTLGPAAGDALQYTWNPVQTVTKPKAKSRLKLVFKDATGKVVGNALSPYFTVTAPQQ